MSKVFKNIENIQKQVEISVTSLLANKGYSLVNKEKFGDSQALLLQWANKDRQHSFQLIWDIREDWFSLGDFNRVDSLNYIESTDMGIFPYSSIGIFFRKSYDAKYVKKIVEKISNSKPQL